MPQNKLTLHDFSQLKTIPTVYHNDKTFAVPGTSDILATANDSIMEIHQASLLTDFDVSLFKAGKHFKLYEKLGSHIVRCNGTMGVLFAVWAPTATKIAVIGDFNGWKVESNPMNPRWDSSGIWEVFIPNIGQGTIYKYALTAADGRLLEKTDPFAFHWETPPKTASIVWHLKYEWQDKKWVNHQRDTAGQPKPMSVYEMHLASWKRKGFEGNRSLTYREMADELIPHMKATGFTHVELMPVMEHPYEPSWGYQVLGYFAPTSRFGTPQDFMYLVDKLHEAEIGVLLDWVPSHFPMDAHGLYDFDGTHLYEHADNRLGYHPDWKSAIFNYGRNEVRAFLISSAMFWIDRYHADGLRVDAVASMLYLDYSRKADEWIPNIFGGNHNLEAISLIRELNEAIKAEFPHIANIAEESTAFAGVSRPVWTGGLGFDQKWMMGWMHDTLKYMKHDPIHRKFHQDAITFSLAYAFTENFMLPLSHDEVVYGKGSLLERMPGDAWQKFANLRMMFGYMWTHPGTKLLFMGGEFGQGGEWNFQQQLDWWLLDSKHHAGIQTFIHDLNHLYKTKPALYERAFQGDGFQWIAYDDSTNCVMSYVRYGEGDAAPILTVMNMTPVVRYNYNIGVPKAGLWAEVLNSDDAQYGGSGVLNGNVRSLEKAQHGQNQCISLTLAPLSTMIFEWKGAVATSKPAALKQKDTRKISK
ncbi:MAG: hypothetical protein RIS64_2205 [Bacteroidota bacterium]|jgi:1,4-alpha-glucan branching enzyme